MSKIKFLVLSASLFFTCFASVAQRCDDPLILCEQMPEFPGGPDSLTKFIRAKIKYPKRAKLVGITGRVVVSFVVDTSGKVCNINPDLPGPDSSLTNEACRVIASLPRFKPGMQNRKPECVKLRVPVKFYLDSAELPPAPIPYREGITQFPGGMDSLFTILSMHLGPLGNNEKSDSIRISFFIERDGSIEHVTIDKKTKPQVQQTITQTLKKAPLFTPPKQNGKPVRLVVGLLIDPERKITLAP